LGCGAGIGQLIKQLPMGVILGEAKDLLLAGRKNRFFFVPI
jgi:hypothetical protein